MTKSRIEAFSDGVIAILITIMVLELKAPHGTSWAEIRPLVPTLISYVLSFIIIGVYWGNHHYLFHTVGQVNSKIIWANLHLLFWLSLIPFSTGWMGETNFNSLSVMIYAVNQTICGVAYYILLETIVRTIPPQSPFLDILGKQKRKGTISCVLYLISIPVALVFPAISAAIFGFIAVIWWIPDKDIEKSASKKD